MSWLLAVLSACFLFASTLFARVPVSVVKVPFAGSTELQPRADFARPLLGESPSASGHLVAHAEGTGSKADGARGLSWTVPPRSKLLVVAPHPDDETLGAAGLIQVALRQGASVRILYVTNGDGYLEAVTALTDGRKPTADDFRRYGRQRQAEAVEAQLELGVPPSWLQFLGFPDGGIDALWGPYWCSERPYVSPFTQQSRSTVDNGGQYRGAELQHRLAHVLREWQPTVIVIPDPRDVHRDHCAVGVFLLAAITEVAREVPTFRPLVLGYLVHFPHYPGEPSWQQKVRESGACGEKEGRALLAATAWLRLPLEERERQGKARALRRYASQMRVMRGFLEQFVRPEEWFSQLQPKQWQLASVWNKGNAQREACKVVR